MKRDYHRAVFAFAVFILACATIFTYVFIPYDQVGSLFFVDKGKGPKSKVTAPRPGVYNRKWPPAVQSSNKKPAVKTAKGSSKELKVPKEVIAGWVKIIDPWGREINKFKAGLAGNGWMALPASACIGGNAWHFESDSGWEDRLSGGLWIKGDKVGLWHLVNGSGSLEGPGFGPWDAKEPVSWRSIESAGEYPIINLAPGLMEGFFISTRLPDNIDESGVFIQKERIVGWSFGAWPGKGFMWSGYEGNKLQYRTWVEYFYNITFAGGREDKFAMALSMQDAHTELVQLAYFIEGFGLQPKLLLADTPEHLLPEEIIRRMRSTVINTTDREGRIKVADMFSSQVLKNIGDIDLFIDLVPIIAYIQGVEAAITVIEDAGAYIVRRLGRDVPALSRLHRYYYQNWLKSMAADGQAYEGLQVYAAAKDFYPNDPDIHLSGVELVLLNGDWEEAERLIYMKNYPPALQGRFQLLADRISDMKAEEETIVISFTPGSNRIIVRSAVNGSLYQDFLVDTGASTVTIPSSTADALGLDVMYGKQLISTVGGVVEAGQVIIDEIEIDGWIEYDIKAYVVDIPDRPGLGLLGLNYLGRFQMDMNPAKGRLLLLPR